MLKADRHDLITLLAVAGLVGLAVVAIYLPQRRRLAQIDKQVRSQRSQLVQKRQKLSVVPDFARKVARMRQQYADFDRKLPRGKDLGPFLGQLDTCLNRQRLAETKIRTGKPRHESLYSAIPVQLDFRGEFLPLARFLDELEGMKRLTRIEELSIRSDDRRDDLQIDLRMNIYYEEG
jgi:Tfp pilus assembly protein PilO